MRPAAAAFILLTLMAGIGTVGRGFAPRLRQSPAPTGVNAAAPADVVSVFTALQEQLGLKLESRREPLDVVVIESIDRPTPN